jgi:hypothetical protein
MPPTLADLGITKKQSATAQQLAAIPDDLYEGFKAGDTARRPQRLTPFDS